MDHHIDEHDVTRKVNHCLMAFADDVVRRWNELAHLGECHATIEATRLLKTIDQAVRELREENFTFLTAKEENSGGQGMKKTTMYFADHEAEQLAAHARYIGISFAEMVRRVIAEWLTLRPEAPQDHKVQNTSRKENS